jgi:hypothetical protein
MQSKLSYRLVHVNHAAVGRVNTKLDRLHACIQSIGKQREGGWALPLEIHLHKKLFHYLSRTPHLRPCCPRPRQACPRGGQAVDGGGGAAVTALRGWNEGGESVARLDVCNHHCAKAIT